MRWAIGLVALAMTTAAAQAARLPHVIVNDRPLNVAAFVRHQRVFVPMRAIFTRLGATVSYDGKLRVVTATTPRHSVQMQIGNRKAVVDDRIVHLDAAPEIVAARTYVPLRFVAQSLGAVVGYDGREALVTVSLARAAYAAPAVTTVSVGALQPQRGANVATGYPTIAAIVSVPIGTTLQNERLIVDGRDVSQNTTFDGAAMTYMPRSGMSIGTHLVDFSGQTADGTPFGAHWWFQTTINPVEAGDWSGGTPLQFVLNGPGSFGPYASMNFSLLAPPGGSAYLLMCNSPYRYWMWGSGNYYQASIPAPYGYTIVGCPVQAVYVGWNGATWYVPYPVFINLYTDPNVQPAPPSPAYRSTQPIGRRAPIYSTPAKRLPMPIRRRIEPTPKPTAAPTPYIIRRRIPRPIERTPRPIATLAPRPIVTQAPQPRPQPQATARPEPPRQPEHVPHPRPRRTDPPTLR